MNLPGKSLFDWLKEKKSRETASSDELPIEAMTPEGAGEGFQIGIKKKRHSAMLKKMLHDSGYGELAKMISVRENKE